MQKCQSFNLVNAFAKTAFKILTAHTVAFFRISFFTKTHERLYLPTVPHVVAMWAAGRAERLPHLKARWSSIIKRTHDRHRFRLTNTEGASLGSAAIWMIEMCYHRRGRRLILKDKAAAMCTAEANCWCSFEWVSVQRLACRTKQENTTKQSSLSAAAIVSHYLQRQNVTAPTETEWLLKELLLTGSLSLGWGLCRY